ncbi:probable LRR receptor-like serine/threonine-protein kinase At1g67720 isoform X3 [Cryptomeria japonica]|nr:probable LRR receptor-like serine/threonine-protein kinase At1g67720 isoform X3 [Cryptomeria japonica]XP_059072731.1 probable LRR receptor-like serine/threonine-protein kinase At1g67720 isoform X3 [Cryptomeria japonica]
MTALVKLSLDNNHLTGGLPDLSKLVMLERLHLQNNDLSGDVPDWLSELPNLKDLFIGNNNFSGVIPQKLQDLNLLELTYEGNNYLCVRKEECRLSSHSHGRRGKTVSVPVVVCPIAIAGIISLLGIIIYRKKFGRKEIANSGTQGTPTGNRESRYVPGQDNLIISVPSTPKSRSFSLEEMMTATKNFSRKIGQGGFGSVFLGELAEGKQIAVKILSFFSEQGIAQFLNEIELLSRAHHRNLVCLLGYCNASRDLMLVYEYMSGGSLNDHLYGRNKSKYPKLGWKSRLKIALHAAQGLEYLHTNCTPKIIHRDIKTANILLDANLTGKLADFGLSRVAADDVSHVITAVRGTAGYVDPKYFTTHVLTEKSDVYSFGVVLLEIICGRRPIDITLSEPQVDLVKWVMPLVKEDEDFMNIKELVDKSMDNNYNKDSVIYVAKLAMRCIESKPIDRPSSSDVVMEIKGAMKYEI